MPKKGRKSVFVRKKGYREKRDAAKKNAAIAKAKALEATAPEATAATATVAAPASTPAAPTPAQTPAPAPPVAPIRSSGRKRTPTAKAAVLSSAMEDQENDRLSKKAKPYDDDEETIPSAAAYDDAAALINKIQDKSLREHLFSCLTEYCNKRKGMVDPVVVDPEEATNVAGAGNEPIVIEDPNPPMLTKNTKVPAIEIIPLDSNAFCFKKDGVTVRGTGVMGRGTAPAQAKSRSVLRLTKAIKKE